MTRILEAGPETPRAGGVRHERHQCRDVAHCGDVAARGATWAETSRFGFRRTQFGEGPAMNSIIYLVGLVVIVMAILSFVGLR
jgi:hypothetical protein